MEQRSDEVSTRRAAVLYVLGSHWDPVGFHPIAHLLVIKIEPLLGLGNDGQRPCAITAEVFPFSFRGLYIAAITGAMK